MQVTKEDADEGCTQYAQGGISAVLADMDSYEDHIRDTLIAGDFLNCREWGPLLNLSIVPVLAESQLM